MKHQSKQLQADVDEQLPPDLGSEPEELETPEELPSSDDGMAIAEACCKKSCMAVFKRRDLSVRHALFKSELHGLSEKDRQVKLFDLLKQIFEDPLLW